MTQTQIIDLAFYGDTVVLAEHDGWAYVSVRCVAERVGVADPRRQVEQIEADVETYGDRIWYLDASGYGDSSILARNNKPYVPELFLRKDMVPIWLAGINPRRLRPEYRQRLALYKRELAAIIDGYFSGQKVLPRSCTLALPGTTGTQVASDGCEEADALNELASDPEVEYLVTSSWNIKGAPRSPWTLGQHRALIIGAIERYGLQFRDRKGRLRDRTNVKIPGINSTWKQLA